MALILPPLCFLYQYFIEIHVVILLMSVSLAKFVVKIGQCDCILRLPGGPLV